MTTTMTREQAAAAVAAATAERDGIQANLLDLDDSFGKRMLAGAPLVGESKRRWEAAAADLAILWEILPAYAAVTDRAAEMLASGRHLHGAEPAEITALLSGASVKLTRGPGRPEQRDLTDSCRRDLTLAAAVREMKGAFARTAEVVAAAERVWNETADGLTAIAAVLYTAQQQADGLGDDELTGALDEARADLGRLRDVLESDPLALWHGRVDTTPMGLLRKRADEVDSRAGDLARLRDAAQQRIDAAAAAVTAAAAARRDAAAARDRADAEIAVPALPALPAEPTDLGERLAALGALRAAGRWSRLASELDIIETGASAALRRHREAGQAAVAMLDWRDELGDLLDAYQARAAQLGAAEDPELTASYQHARDLIRAAPCDLSAAATAVTRHKRAILALSEQTRRRLTR
jgi:hypothetical protein